MITRIPAYRFLPLFLLGFATTAFAQDPTKLNFSLANKVADMPDPQRPVHVFAQGDVALIRAHVQRLGGAVKYAAGDIVAAVLPVNRVPALAAAAGVLRIEDNDLHIQPLCDSLLSKSNVNPVHQGMSPLPLGYDGTGVVMGIIDSGIDFNHGDFKDSQGKTRVKFIWDHNLTGNAPSPYNYGREFNAADIDNGQATAHVDNSFGHGTHVTGVAAGNGSAVGYFTGVAPGTDIISVCIKWSLPDNQWYSNVADAVNYIYSKADSMGKPCVINISAGSYYGSHDAKDLQAQMIDNLITGKAGRALVCAGGNLGNWPIHLQYDTPTGTDTVFTWFSRKGNPVSNPLSTVYLEMWADQPSFPNVRFTVSGHKDAPGYEHRGELAWSGVSNHIGSLKTDTIWSPQGNRLARVQTYASLSNGRYSMIFNIIEDSAYVWSLDYTGAGKFDLWSFQFWEFSGTLPSDTAYPPIVRYNAPDITQNIVSSFTCSDKVITAAEYINKGEYTDCNGNIQVLGYNPDSLSPGSSHGPTRTGLVKPDISSPGNFTFAAAVTYFIGNTQPLSKIIQQGCMHVRDGGTSTASPGIAGIAALYFERYPTHTWQQVRNAILLCARRDTFTGFTGFPKNDWGYGKADAFETLVGCAALGVDGLAAPPAGLVLSPNPSGLTVVAFDPDPLRGHSAHLLVTDIAGRPVRTVPLDGRHSSVALEAGSLARGTYVVSLVIDGRVTSGTRWIIP